MSSTVLASALEQAVARATALVESLAPHELEELATGRATLVYRPAEVQIERQLADRQLADHRLAGQLAEHLEHREAMPTPRAHRTARRDTGRRAVLGIDITGVVERINGCGTSAEVASYLNGLDARFTVPVLREIARALGPTVNATGRTKGQLQRDIVEGTAGFRERTAAMSGGAWG